MIEHFRLKFKWLRGYLYGQLVCFNAKSVIKVQNEVKAADYIVTLMEELEIHNQF